MSNEKKRHYIYGGAIIHIVNHYGEQDFDTIVEQVIMQKVLEDLEQTDN